MGTLPPINKTSIFGTSSVYQDIYTTQSDQCPGTIYQVIEMKTMIPTVTDPNSLEQQLDQRLRDVTAAREFMRQASVEVEKQILQQIQGLQDAVQAIPAPPPLPPAPTPWSEPTPGAAFCRELEACVPGGGQCPTPCPGGRQQWPQAPQPDRPAPACLPAWAAGQQVAGAEWCGGAGAQVPMNYPAPADGYPAAGQDDRRQWPQSPDPTPTTAPGWAGGPTTEVRRRPWTRPAAADGASTGVPRWAAMSQVSAPSAPPQTRAPRPRPYQAPPPRPRRSRTELSRPPWMPAGRPRGDSGPTAPAPRRSTASASRRQQPQPVASTASMRARAAVGGATPRRFGVPAPGTGGLIEDIVARFNCMEETAFDEVQSSGGQHSILNQSVAAVRGANDSSRTVSK